MYFTCRTSLVYLCFNVLITGIATTFYVMHFTSVDKPDYPDLTTITAIYDLALTERDNLLKRLIPGLSFLMIVMSAIISISIFIYTSSRIIRRHPNYIMCLGGLFVSIASLICPHFLISRYLDLRVVGTLIVCALIIDLISITWVYGSKDLYTDLEFSIGRPIMKFWLFMWAICPLILIGLLSWWCVLVSQEALEDYWPRWIPVAVCVTILLSLACYEVSKQVDYNLCSMIHEATRPSKEWGPADPLVRHAWKQWKSVCEDTGQRDFTLRRRGTKDYTSSIKKGQYSHANKYNSTNAKNSSTTGSNSPNYSGCGSVFGDSAIEEDMSVDKYPNQLDYHVESRSRKTSANNNNNSNYRRHISDASNHSNSSHRSQQQQLQHHIYQPHNSHYHSQKIPIRHGSRKNNSNNINNNNNYTSRIEITPQETPYIPSNFQSKNSLSPLEINPHFITAGHYATDKYPGNYHHHQELYRHHHPSNNGHLIISSEGSGRSGSMTTNTTSAGGTDHLYWRKFSMNSDEFSTEL